MIKHTIVAIIDDAVFASISTTQKLIIRESLILSITYYEAIIVNIVTVEATITIVKSKVLIKQKEMDQLMRSTAEDWD